MSGDAIRQRDSLRIFFTPGTTAVHADQNSFLLSTHGCMSQPHGTRFWLITGR
jgi:hypothetical protein